MQKQLVTKMRTFELVNQSGHEAVLQVFCPVCTEPKRMTVTREQLLELCSPSCRSVQHVLPNMPAAERELLLTGICGKCWDKEFRDESA